MKITELFLNEDNQWTVEVAGKPGYVIQTENEEKRRKYLGQN
jgi:hypothetical protein